MRGDSSGSSSGSRRMTPRAQAALPCQSPASRTCVGSCVMGSIFAVRPATETHRASPAVGAPGGGGRCRVRGGDDEDGVAEPDLVAGPDAGRAGQPPPVHAGAVHRPEVGDHPALVGPVDLGVEARDGQVGEDELAAGGAADDDPAELARRQHEPRQPRPAPGGLDPRGHLGHLGDQAGQPVDDAPGGRQVVHDVGQLGLAARLQHLVDTALERLVGHPPLGHAVAEDAQHPVPFRVGRSHRE